GALDELANSEAADINDAGQIVGKSSLNLADQAFIWDSKQGMRSIHPLGCLQSAATGINNRGEVVGYAVVRESQLNRPFIWDAQWGTRFLPILPSESCMASSINDRGQIAGSVFTSRGRRACMWDTADRPPRLIDLVPGVYDAQATAIDSV